MSRLRAGVLVLAAAVLAASVFLAGRARGGESLQPGGFVPSTISLSLSEASPFRATGGGGRERVFTSVIRAEVTTTVPVQLSVADGEVSSGRRLGHLVQGSSVLSPALEAQAGAGGYRPLDATPPPELKRWGQPLSLETTKVRLRQRAPDAGALRGHRKLVLVTLTAGGP
ncbi:MAG: hypothetical protein U0R71_16335 [Solirubrobacterales bacterium]